MVSSISRSFSRSGALSLTSASSQSCYLHEAALERCGNAPSEIDASAVASSATCCDDELAKLAQACWTCSKPGATDAECAAAVLEADIAIGMSTCMSRMPAALPSSFEYQPLHLHMFAQRDEAAHPAVYQPSTLFLVSFFGAVSLLAIALMSFVVHRCRKARPYEKRAHRRRVLDLMEGFTPVDKSGVATPEPTRDSWVQFKPDNDAVSPPPPVRPRTPSPPAVGDMFEVRRPTARPVAHGLEVPQLLLTPSRVENGAMVMVSPLFDPVPIRRY